jgi:signal transduction histidine kinase
MPSARTIFAAFRQLAGGLGTAFLALGVLILLPLTAVVGQLRAGLRVLHRLAGRERARLGRWGPEIIEPADAPETTRRELTWLVLHATRGFLLGFIGVFLPIYALRDTTFPLWWQLLPEGEATASITTWVVHDWPGVFAVGALGLVWAAATIWLIPPMSRWQANPGRRLLAPGPDTDLSLRVAELTATRAAALDAHATELRRIERSLHDGTQNRLVTTAVLLGAARRALERDPAAADALLQRAQDAAELALVELRAVARGILPPVLADRGLTGALSGLAAACPVPCEVDVQVPGRCAASVEATAYFVVAEALTNIAKHSGASHAAVHVRRLNESLTLRISDDGHGGATEADGSGLNGIRRRIEAYDGSFSVDSPAGGPTILEVRLPCGS